MIEGIYLILLGIAIALLCRWGYRKDPDIFRASYAAGNLATISLFLIGMGFILLLVG